MALSVWMKDRIGQQSFEMQGQLNRMLLGEGVINSAQKLDAFIKEHGYFGQTMLQNRMDVVVWTAAYDHAVASNSSDPVGDADKAVRDTQGSFAPEDISNIEAGNAWWRAGMKFYSYFGMLANTMGTQSAKAVRDNSPIRAAGRLAYLWFIVFGVSNMIAQGIAQGFPDDDDDEDGDGALVAWLQAYLGVPRRAGLWADLYVKSNASVVAAMAPGIGTMVNLGVNMLDESPVNDRLSVSPMLSYVTRSLAGAVDLYTGEALDEDVKAKEIKNLLAFIGLTGIPTGQLAKSIGYVVNEAQGNVEAESVTDYALGVARGR
jgi:hypothetical protein